MIDNKAEAHKNMVRLADMLRAEIPRNLGFTLFVFEQKHGVPTDDGPGRVAYISTATQESFMRAMLEWLEKERAKDGDARAGV